MILSIGMMLNWLGDKHNDKRLKNAWTGIDNAVDFVLRERKVRTPDLGGTNNTVDFGGAVVEALITS
jgi:3-isopropylmalate dehydrogenase